MARYGRLLTDAQREKIRPLQDVWLKIWRAFLAELNQREQLHRSESFLDGSLVPAKKGALESEKASGARARNGWWWSHPRKPPNPRGAAAAETAAPDRRSWLRPYPLLKQLAVRGIELIAPHRWNRSNQWLYDFRVWYDD
jgi:hypothetical protein